MIDPIDKWASEEAHAFCKWFEEDQGYLPYAFHMVVRLFLVQAMKKYPSTDKTVSKDVD